MTVDLSLYLNKNVEITYRCGKRETSTIVKSVGPNSDSRPYLVQSTGHTYRENGMCRSRGYGLDYADIVNVRPVSDTKYAHLEEQVAKIQAEIERLRKEEEAEKPKLPYDFNRNHALAILDGNFTFHNVHQMCIWHSTPHGWSYWENIGQNHHKPLPDGAIQYLQQMVILSYRQQYGD